MSFRDYLHEKAEESRHNETVAYLMFLAGTMLFVGGVLITLSITSEPGWLLFIPYYAEAHAGAVLALALTISGFSLLIFGIIAGIHYSHDRGWYMQELNKTNSVEETLLRNKSATKNHSKIKKKKSNHFSN
jgi:cytochrome b subunit of formate dehydrogenase